MPRSRERRATPRVRSERFLSPFGEVVDVGGGGMSVIRRGRPVAVGETLRLSIAWSGRMAAVDCVVQRVARAGFRRQQVGLRWIEPPAGLASWLRDAEADAGTECIGPVLYRRSA